MGEANMAAWTAVGLRQSLDAEARRVSMTYVGVGSVSGRHDDNPVGRAAIFVLNEELYDQFDKHWLYSVALSYRRQDAAEGPAWQRRRVQELRAYARLSSVLTSERLKLLNTVRPEVRGFVRPDFGPSEEPLQLRFRLKTQLTWQLDAAGQHRLIGGAEELASIAHAQGRAAWTDFDYRESRFSVFYALSSRRLPLVVDVGYMNNLLGHHGALVDVSYVSLDVVWLDPFGKPDQR
jgi:hypothetical protein